MWPHEYPTLNREANESLVAQIERIVTDLIGQGELAPGDLLSARALADHWACTRSTVLTALTRLATVGVLDNQMGRGFMVREAAVYLALVRVRQATFALAFPTVTAAEEWGQALSTDAATFVGCTRLVDRQQLDALIANAERSTDEVPT